MERFYHALAIVALPYLGLSQNVGIGTTTPSANLEVVSGLFSKVRVSAKSNLDTSGIIFKNQGGGLFTEMGIALYREEGLRFYSKSDLLANTNDNIFHLTPTGSLSIGTPIVSGYKLTLAGKLLMKHSGTIPTISFSRSNQTIAGSIGMENDDYIGLFGGNGANWGFGMQVFTGALKIGGSTGTTGQVLTSKGSGLAPVWSNMAPTITTKIIASPLDEVWFADVNLVTVDIPNMFITFTVNQTSTVVVSAQVSVTTESCSIGCSVGDGWYYLKRVGVDDAEGAGRVNQRTSNLGPITFVPFSEDLPAGTYTYKLSLKKRSGSRVALGSSGNFGEDSKNNMMTVQIFPK